MRTRAEAEQRRGHGGASASAGILLMLLLLAGCGEGLSPNDAAEMPGFGGTIRIVSAWPPADSVKDLRVVAFRNYPPQNLVLEVTQGTAVYTDSSLATFRPQIDYAIRRSTVTGAFQYIVVAQQYGSNLFADWRVVGVYSLTGDKTRPGAITIPQGKFLQGIDIPVDFYNLPPQPF